MTYIYLGLVGVLSGGAALAAGLGPHWLGAAVILVGGVALALGASALHRNRAAKPEHAADGPYTAEDFYRPNAVPPRSGAVPIHRLPVHIDAAPDGAHFVVGYGDYVGPILGTDDPWQMCRGELLALAFRATPEADPVEPAAVGHENATGLLEDDFIRYECRVRVCEANALALRATGIAWTDAAERLAVPVEPPAEAVEAVRQQMVQLARQAVEPFITDLGPGTGAASGGSAER